jgi:hypothetical protein
MRRIANLSVSFVALFGLAAANPGLVWSWSTIPSNPDGNDQAQSVEIESAGDVVAAGFRIRAGNDMAFIVAKYSGFNGSTLWLVEIEGTISG